MRRGAVQPNFRKRFGFCLNQLPAQPAVLRNIRVFIQNTKEGLNAYVAFFIKTRPKPAYGRQGLDWDRWARITNPPYYNSE